jgi:hypothetical protein
MSPKRLVLADAAEAAVLYQIGWGDNQRRARLHLVANNARFCRLKVADPYPNLATRSMGLNWERLSADWQAQ